MNRLRATWVSVVSAVFILFLSGCGFTSKWKNYQSVKLGAADAAIEKESKAMTTAIVDTLSLGPTNLFTDLALEFARRDQQLEGTPLFRIDTKGLLEGTSSAWRELNARYREQNELLQERELFRAKLRVKEEELIRMGEMYEKEKNSNIVKRIWRWGIGTFGIAGIVALCIFCPAVIPILGRMVGWAVGKIPALAGALGLVSKRAFDSVVEGVGNYRNALKADEEKNHLQALNTALAIATDKEHRELIDRSRKKLKV